MAPATSTQTTVTAIMASQRRGTGRIVVAEGRASTEGWLQVPGPDVGWPRSSGDNRRVCVQAHRGGN